MPVIYIDLDGTLLDVWFRYYTIMRTFFDSVHLPFISLDDYKRLKWRWVQDEAIIQHATKDQPLAAHELVPSYQVWKRERLESQALLQWDEPIGQLHAFAARLKPAYRLNLISVRRDHEAARRQLQELNMMAPFERIDWVSPSRERNPKWEALKNRADRGDLIVGDSETDIGCGSMLGLRSFHVQTGLRSFEYAARHGHAIKLQQYDDILSYL
ncbi:HAD family hydrolase [Cohnella pontilimi]|uniref:HAD family hydrolase n=1 Tax=Cohnella pontilimi TaxID=2564100 RepID=A0A4U0FE51_9BACL|nr:HAD hydrolase-like protein [Cohnella pontilimi]TJY43091.1 HAD family hydrolase [Cohnella pontilimi]